MSEDSGYGSYEVDTSPATTQEQLDSYQGDPILQEVLQQIQQGANDYLPQVMEALMGTSEDFSKLPRDQQKWMVDNPEGRDYVPKGSKVDASLGQSISDMLGWTGAKDDVKTSVVASLIAGMFKYPMEKQKADAASRTSKASQQSAQANADLAASTISLQNNKSKGIIASNAQPNQYVDLYSQRRAQARTGG